MKTVSFAERITEEYQKLANELGVTVEELTTIGLFMALSKIRKLKDRANAVVAGKENFEC